MQTYKEMPGGVKFDLKLVKREEEVVILDSDDEDGKSKINWTIRICSL
jgi:hypothetical protein